MEQAVLLTKNDCPYCEQLKKFLHFALQDRYAPHLIIVHKEEQPNVFEDYVKQYQIKETPTLLFNDDKLVGFAPQSVVDFLTRHFGKK
jgi:glutaredoxin-like protein NrdH